MGNFQSRRHEPPAVRTVLGLGLSLLVVVLLARPQLVLAEGGNEGGGLAGTSPGTLPLTGIIHPVSDNLSSSSWLFTNALDPEADGKLIEQDPLAGWESPLGAGPAAGASTNQRSAIQQVPFRNPAPSMSRNLLITRQLGYQTVQTEPSIAVDPTDPEHLVMGAIDYNLAGNIAAYTSFDGGETWQGPNRIRYFQEDFGAAGDPVVVFDADGTVYVSMISIGIEDFRIGALVSETEVSSLIVAKSLDGGLTWNDPISAARSTATSVSQTDDQGRQRGQITLSFLDKEWMTTGPSASDPSKTSIYMTYTDFASTYGLLYSDELPFLSTPFTTSTIMSVHSEDGGVTWSKPVAVSPAALQSFGTSEAEDEAGVGASILGGTPLSDAELEQAGIDRQAFDRAHEGTDVQAQDAGNELQEQQTAQGGESDRTVQGSQPRVLSDGTVVVAYLDTTNDGSQKGLCSIMMASSTDGGKTFGAPIQAGMVREPHFRPRNTNFRYWGTVFPQIAVGPNDEIYIATTGVPSDKIADDGDIYLFRSFDKGQKWENGVRLNTDQSNAPQFFPSIAVSADGVVHAMWGDMRDDPDQVRYNVYYSASTDKGQTWGFKDPVQNFTAPDTRVTDFASNSLKGFTQGLFIGDYFSIAATQKDVYMVWADTRQGEYAGINQQIGFARKTAIKSPSIFLNPPSGSAGRTVDIQGFDFEPFSNIQLLVSGVIVSNERTNDKGQFQTQIFMPVTGQGATSISVYDETGNAATASFFTEFGFDTIQQSLDGINQALGVATTGPAASPVAPTVASPVVTAAATAPAAPTSVSPVATTAGSPAVQPTAPPLIAPKQTPTPASSGDIAPASNGGSGLSSGGLGLATGLLFGGLVYGGMYWRRRRI
ncbi:MAG: sialidase family protein [Thermomicrobiales bacterium]